MRRIVALACLLALFGCSQDLADADDKSVGEVQTVKVDGTKVAWYETGDGPPLVMLMGTGSTMAEWDPALLDRLAAHHRLILVDYPGLGLSGPWEGTSFDDLAATVSGFMRAIDVEHADVLGWSMGGFVAQRLAIDHPERVDALILAGTNPGGSRAVLGSPEVQRIDSLPNPTDEDILSELYPPDQKAEGRRFLRRLETASDAGDIPDDFDVPARTVTRQVAAEDPWLSSDRNDEQLVGIQAPTLVATGRQDRVTPPRNMHIIAEQIPGARLQTFAGAHAFLFQDRVRFTRAVDRITGVKK